MTWTDIDIYSVPQLIDKTALDTLKANLLYLHQPNQASYAHPGTGSDYTVTGSLGVDLDATNFALTITTTGGLVMTCFHGSLKAPAAQVVRMSIIRDELVGQAGRNLFYDFDVDVAQAISTPRGWMKPFVGLPAGSHTFRVIWGVSGAGTGTLEVAYPPFFAAWEW